MNALVEISPQQHMRRVAVAVSVLLPACIVAALLVIWPWFPRLEIPDEKIVAAELLDQKLSGPRYFHPSKKSAPRSGEAKGEIRIALEDAKSQVAKIGHERQLSPEQARKLEQLIDRLAEPSPSRTTGETTVNLLR